MQCKTMTYDVHTILYTQMLPQLSQKLFTILLSLIRIFSSQTGNAWSKTSLKSGVMMSCRTNSS